MFKQKTSETDFLDTQSEVTLKTIVRPANELDLPRLTNFMQAYTEEARSQWGFMGLCPEKAVMHAAMAIGDPNHLMLVAVRGTEIIGFSWVQLFSYVWSEDLLVSDLFVLVKPSLRGFGVAPKFISKIEEWSSSKGAKGVVLGAMSGINDNRNACKLYERLGYKQLGVNFLKVTQE